MARQDLLRRGKGKHEWSGVRNHLAHHCTVMLQNEGTEVKRRPACLCVAADIMRIKYWSILMIRLLYNCHRGPLKVVLQVVGAHHVAPSWPTLLCCDASEAKYLQ